MPISTRTFTGTDHEGCNCYKCRSRRELRGFNEWYNSLGEKFNGMIPRNYHLSRISNNNVTSDITLEQAESVKFQVKQILDYNASKIEGATPAKIRKHEYCIDCGKIHLREQTRITTHNGEDRFLCHECSKLHYRLCTHCHKYQSKRTSIRFNELYYCAECFVLKFYKCNRCDRIQTLGTEHKFLFSSMHGNLQMYVICPDCRLSLQTCTTCRHHFFDSPRNTINRRGMCPQCFIDQSEIKQYSYKPSARWKTSVKTERFRADTLFAGFEWELENRSGRDQTGTPKLIHETQAEKLSTLMGEGFIYFKKDGSLSNGFEVVTHPFTWQFYHDNREKFKAMVSEAYKNGMRAERTCGFHVHMSKKAFSHGQMYKFVKFIYEPLNTEFIDVVSERPQRTSYAAFRDSDQRRVAKFAKNKCNQSEDRHSAVNATGNHTVEVRFFASTTNQLSFLKNIEFVFALYEYAGVCSYKQFYAQDFLKWLSTRSAANKYRNLVRWLKDSNIPDSMRGIFRKQLKKNKANLNLKKGE
jgi:hypothetical protein